ncbi:hypothetical protein Kisp01_38100 [Kineosporia sp. NBRC 101677]|nr:hypothetical protein Kisp01_38100 [Kineosporia sp. NBRC 101677]
MIAGALVLLVVAAASVAWKELRFEARREAVAQAPFDLLIQPGVSEAEVAAVRDGLSVGFQYLNTQMDAGVRQRVQVRLAHQDGCEPFTSPAGPPTGWADARRLCLNTKAPGWREQFADDPALASIVAAHEHVHNAQAQLGCFAARDEHEWLWLFEGMAEHLSFQAMSRAGRWPDARTVPLMREWGAADPDLDQLRAYENGGAVIGDAAYALFHIATRHLDALAPKASAMMDFCRSVGRGQPWHDAFEQAFGLTVDNFYARFEQNRSQLIAQP